MALDNFYEKIGEDDRRLGRLAFFSLLCFCILCSLVVYLLSSGRGQPRPRSSGAEERLKRIDELCANLPKPEKFAFLSRETKNNPSVSFVTYNYSSERSKEETMPFFTVWLYSNGWKPVSSDYPVFLKDKQTVGIFVYPSDKVSARYEIVCSETG